MPTISEVLNETMKGTLTKPLTEADVTLECTEHQAHWTPVFFPPEVSANGNTTTYWCPKGCVAAVVKETTPGTWSINHVSGGFQLRIAPPDT